jgi:hypothetical protein
MQSAAFRFNEEEHEYQVDGKRVPHITGLLTVAGWCNEQWYDDNSSERGRGVHKGTADYDLGALSARAIARPGTRWRGWLMAWVEGSKIVRPRWRHVEVAAVHRRLGFGGRPDRVGQVFQAHAVCEVKSGAIEKGHMVQTALQAILVEDEVGLPAEHIKRYAGYIDERGRFRLEEHKNPADFREARRIIRRYV